MAAFKTPRHVHDEAIAQVFNRVPKTKQLELEALTNVAETELDEAVEAERANSFALGHAAGYDSGYNHGYHDGHTDRLTAEEWDNDPRKEAIDQIAKEEEE